MKTVYLDTFPDYINLPDYQHLFGGGFKFIVCCFPHPGASHIYIIIIMHIWSVILSILVIFILPYTYWRSFLPVYSQTQGRKLGCPLSVYLSLLNTPCAPVNIHRPHGITVWKIFVVCRATHQPLRHFRPLI